MAGYPGIDQAGPLAFLDEGITVTDTAGRHFHAHGAGARLRQGPIERLEIGTRLGDYHGSHSPIITARRLSYPERCTGSAVMFEHYTEKARRVVFFARYEARQLGATHIEPAHLLLGLMQEDQQLMSRLVAATTTRDALRARLEKDQPVREKLSVSA